MGEYITDSQGRQTYRETKSGDDVANAQTAAKAGTTAGAGLGARQKIGKKPMPKQSDFGGDMSAWGAAMRTWRTEQENEPENKAQKKVLGSMK